LVGATVSGNTCSFSEAAGVVVGDINATFLCCSVVVIVAMVSTLPVIFLRDEDRTVISVSGRGEVTVLIAVSLSRDCRDISALRGVGVSEKSFDADSAGSLMGGNGRCGTISGRGL
jgi:hypothetical protein